MKNTYQQHAAVRWAECMSASERVFMVILCWPLFMESSILEKEIIPKLFFLILICADERYVVLVEQNVPMLYTVGSKYLALIGLSHQSRSEEKKYCMRVPVFYCVSKMC